MSAAPKRYDFPMMPDAAFPIMEGGARRADGDLKSIPWAMIAPHDATAQRNHGGQNLVRLAQRGGLCPLEAVAVLEDAEYRKRWPDTWDRETNEKRTLEARAILKKMVANWTPPNVEVCDGGRKASELEQDANRHSQH